jgi:tripartite-type tricarboxylate transporter receptor subunit TctC
VADFYRGKTIKLLVGTTAGGLPDLSSRLLARFMPRYVPGSPTMIVENRAGAGGFLAANSFYNVEPQDGTVMIIFFGTIVLQQALGAEGIQFDAGKFQWLGSVARTPVACAVRTDTGVTSIQQVIDGREVVIASTGRGTTINDTPAVLNAALQTKFKIVSGYPGIQEIVLAVDRKEADGFCAGIDPMKQVAGHLLEGANPVLKVLVIAGSTTPDDPLLRGVPATETLAKTEEARQMLRAVAAPSDFTNSFAVAPGVPQDRFLALKWAVSSTFADPEFQSEAQKARIPVRPVSGEELTQLISNLLNTPPATLARLKEALN